jgi:hypothetical protein
MTLKWMVPKGWLVLWAKEKQAAAPAPSTASTPTPTPQTQSPAPQAPPAASQAPPAAGASLVGVWQGEEGDVLKVADSTFEVYESGQLMDSGSYQISGNKLRVRSSLTGETEQFTFRLQGHQLVLKDSEGEVFNYRRLK